MYITYQDDLGVICVEVNTEYGVTFDGVYAYFNDSTNLDYRVSVADIIEIKGGM